MRRVPFFKLSGAGNDFIVLVEPEVTPRPEWIREISQRGVSLGADGVFVLRRQADSQIRMVHFNADGGRAELCLNGTRCAVRLGAHLGWGETQRIITDNGPIEGLRIDTNTVRLTWAWTSPSVTTKELDLANGRVSVQVVDVGVPYAILNWEGNLENAPVRTLGAAVRDHELLAPRGANVAFVQSVTGDKALMRSFERGVEDETLASGTGVIATAWCMAAGSEPFTVITSAGFELTAQFADGQAQLQGDARLLAEGTVYS